MEKAVKKKWEKLEIQIPIDGDISAEYNDGILKISGPKGEISKKLRYPGINIIPENDKIVVRCLKATRAERKIIFTYRAHIRNLIKGVKEGFEYTLRVVYAKFPMTVEFKDGKLIVKNFLGEKISRILSIPNDVSVKIAGKEIVVSGVDKEKVGQVAANIEQLTRITHLDRRVIQDGIYIIKKPHKSYI